MKKRKRWRPPRKTDRDYRVRDAPVDWEANYAQSQRLEKIVDSSRLERGDIAKHLGISGEHLSRLLRVRTVHLGPRMERKIEQAVRYLMRQTRIEVEQCMRMKVVESKTDTARVERINRIIQTSKVSQREIAGGAGISTTTFYRALRKQDIGLLPKLERKIEQAVWDLLSEAHTETHRLLGESP